MTSCRKPETRLRYARDSRGAASVNDGRGSMGRCGTGVTGAALGALRVRHAAYLHPALWRTPTPVLTA